MQGKAGGMGRSLDGGSSELRCADPLVRAVALALGLADVVFDVAGEDAFAVGDKTSDAEPGRRVQSLRDLFRGGVDEDEIAFVVDDERFAVVEERKINGPARE